MSNWFSGCSCSEFQEKWTRLSAWRISLKCSLNSNLYGNDWERDFAYKRTASFLPNPHRLSSSQLFKKASSIQLTITSNANYFQIKYYPLVLSINPLSIDHIWPQKCNSARFSLPQQWRSPLSPPQSSLIPNAMLAPLSLSKPISALISWPVTVTAIRSKHVLVGGNVWMIPWFRRISSFLSKSCLWFVFALVFEWIAANFTRSWI